MSPAPLRRPTRRSVVAFILAASVLSTLCWPPAMHADDRELSEDDLARSRQLREDMRHMIEAARDRVFPSLVNISVSTVNYWGGREHKGQATGSGTIISLEGYVITNQHVTNKGKKFKCTLADKQEISAKMIGEDPLTDLAIIQLDLSELESPATPLPVARFGDSMELKIGDHVMAMGSPFSLSRSVTLGIASNTERVFASGRGGGDVDEMELDSGQRTGLFTRWIQHDALINPGNSGGPLVNLRGEIIGINELGGNGMGFAIPSNLARQVADALIEHGEVPRSWIGVSFKSIAKTGYEQGVLVNSVIDAGPAAKAGIEPGDLVLRIEGDALTVRFIEQIPPLLKRIADLPVGSSLRVTYQRKGATAEATITTEKLQKDLGDEAALRSWGITAEQITPKTAREMKLENAAGILVGGVRSGGPAQLAEPQLRYGDIIRKIDGDQIADLPAMVARYEEIMDLEELPEYLLIEFERDGKSHLTLVKPKLDENDDPPRDVRKAWIGIATQPIVKKLAKKLGHPDQPGWRITRVYPRSIAAGSDLKVGDVVVGLNGEALRLKGVQDAGLLSRKIKKLEIGDEATITVLRNGDTREVTVLLEKSHYSSTEARRVENREFELTVRNVTFFDRDANQWEPDVKGVLIVSVESGGWAGLGGLRPGDLIQRVDDTVIRGRKGFRKALEKVAEDKPERVVFVVLRGIQTRFQFVEPEWKVALEGDEDATDKKEAATKEADAKE